MEDRELSHVERVLRGYLSGHLDRLPVRSTPSFARRSRRWIRTAVAIPATMLVVLLAIGAGLGLADWRAHRTPDESLAVAGGIPGPLNLAGGTPSLGFGLVSSSANVLLVRNEVTETAPLTIAAALPQVAVSPNGHEIAYWLALPDRFSAGPVYELHHADLLVAGSTVCCSGMLMRAPAGEGPGPIVWSSDGTGLIANTHTAPTRGSDAGTPPGAIHSSWFAIEAATGKSTALPAGFAAVVSTVYAWDRQHDLITGSGFDAGRTTFTALQAGRITTNAIPTGAVLAAADAYGRTVVLAYASDCKGVNVTARCPTLESRDQATFVVIVALSVGQATTDFPDVAFRPRSQDLIVQLPLQKGDAQVELWSDLGRGPHQMLATYTQLVRGSIRFTSRRELMLPRVDGSAVFLLKFDNSAGGRWFGEIVSLGPTSTTRSGFGPERTPFEILTGGNPLASVVLDPAFARSMEPSKTLSSPPPADTLPASGLPIGYVASNACTVITANRASDGSSARWTFTCKGLMTSEAWREGLRTTALDQGWREFASGPEVLEFVKDDLRLAMTIQTRPPDGAFALTQRVLRLDDEVIRAVLESPTGAAFAQQFPSSAGSQTCTVRGGGPAPGISVSGTCRTEAQLNGSSYTVNFTFTWDASKFHYAGDPSSGELRHTWSFGVDAAGTVAPPAESGNFPPQYVR
jgi:hypothetical protein